MTQSYTDRWSTSLMNNYGTPPLTLVRGEGPYVFDDAGNRYLDLLAGIAVNILGHAHPKVVDAVSKQIATLGHVSNLYAHPLTIELAERLISLAGRPGKALFCNSGAEANEAAFKISRLTGRTKIIAAEGAFHGRTMGSLALTGQPAKQDPFRPLPGDVVHVPYGDIDAMRSAVDQQTAMIMLEPIIGEGGVVVPPDGYLSAVQQLARDNGALFVLDEVQTGICRTGAWFAFQHEGLEPDAVTLAKGLGAGMPIGAVLAFGSTADLLGPGSHGTTFGGNPVCAAAALAVLDVAAQDDLNGAAKARGEHLAARLDGIVPELRGRGLLRAFDLPAATSKDVADRLRGKGFLVNNVSPTSIRLAPPLIITDAQLDDFVETLSADLKENA
ncbi:acetylornithine transaminase [Blastococcus sp. Marseille-P5729]|uniref:acetylornithine transaminase n=1 Tax=Blastococcus sp. Marseille-P5729 TaxID=2086582 RepID=UPI000D0E80F3|nr:acetylornithine transaminase [Blastococcus sp. Marseille-P5729]